MKYELRPKKLKRWPQVLISAVIVLALVGVGAVLVARHMYNNELSPLNKLSQKTITITIPSGYSLTDIATLLEEKGIIKNATAFTQYVRNKNASNDLKAGTYDLSPSQSVPEIVSIITGGKIKYTLLTILPGQRLDQIKRTFINSGYSEADVNAALNPAQYKNMPALVDKPSGASLEGYLYPESFQKTGTPTDIVRQSLEEMQKRLTPDIRNAIQTQGLSVHQGIILASMVEKEADRQADRNQIAQVFLSRLHNNMRLESDVTAFYGAALAGKPLSVNFDSPFNTYLHNGLPAGPISNVTLSSLQAVANPAKTDYLYFVAGDDGKVYFSRTKEEHEQNVAKYCHVQC